MSKNKEDAKISPEALQAINALESKEILLELLQLERKKIPLGHVVPITYLITEDTPVELSPPARPFMSFNIFNDGPASVFVITNRSTERPHEVLIGEPYVVNMLYPKISNVRITVARGTTATIRMVTVS